MYYSSKNLRDKNIIFPFEQYEVLEQNFIFIYEFMTPIFI